MNIFIDDERFPVSEDVIICRNFSDFVNLVTTTKETISFISFDHDLGEKQPTGYDIVKWLVDYDQYHDIINENFSFFVHSQNPVGKQNIESLMNNWLNFKVS